MERVRAWLRSPNYQPLDAGPESEDADRSIPPHDGFSRIDYYIFMLLGLAMLWPFNMYLNAGPYLQQRFASDRWISDNFQAAENSVSSLVTLATIVYFTRKQRGANYPRRIAVALLIYVVAFIFLACSTRLLLDVPARGYFSFLILTVLITSFAAGLLQNGGLAYVSGYGQPTYMQAVVVGQAVAGVTPSIVQVAFALLVEPHATVQIPDDQIVGQPRASSSAFGFFLTASVVALLSLFATYHLFARRDGHLDRTKKARATSPDSQATIQPLLAPIEVISVPIHVLAKKLAYLASGAMFCYIVTMASFPVYTQQILSLRPHSDSTRTSDRVSQPAVFIPLAFMFWNAGDLLGRISTAWPRLTPHKRPRLVLLLSVSRALLVPVYSLCNVRGQGAVIPSDAFYLLFQLLFGLTNGYVSTLCMMGAVDHVDADEAEAAGSFMGVCLILGLGIGSVLSFAFTTT